MWQKNEPKKSARVYRSTTVDERVPYLHRLGWMSMTNIVSTGDVCTVTTLWWQIASITQQFTIKTKSSGKEEPIRRPVDFKSSENLLQELLLGCYCFQACKLSRIFHPVIAKQVRVFELPYTYFKVYRKQEALTGWQSVAHEELSFDCFQLLLAVSKRVRNSSRD